MTDDATTILLREMTRRLDEVATRMEAGLGRIDVNYVRRDLFDLTIQRAADAVSAMSNQLEEADKNLSNRISELEDDKKWLVRLVIGFIVMGVLGAVFVAARIGGGSGP